ncbi:MAG: hypothetical protein V3W17_01725 [Desulfobacteria bacterium]
MVTKLGSAVRQNPRPSGRGGFTQRLEKGLSPVAIPGFIRNVANTMSASHRVGMEEMNKRLHMLGWDTVELDYQTLGLIIARSETSGLKGITDSLTKVQVT